MNNHHPVEIEPEHPVTFRKEVAAPFFMQYVKAGESCVMVGVAGGGLRRFVDFLMRTDVQQHYLGDLEQAPLLLKVDCNRIHEVSEWGLDELMLTTLVEGCNRRAGAQGLMSEINQLRMDVITAQNKLLAQRHLELAVDMLIERANLKLYFVLSGFDEVFRTLQDLGLNHLRALRDAHKYRVNFVLCLHQFPEQLRPVLKDMLLARIAQNLLTVGPYSEEDAAHMVRQLEKRTGREMTPGLRQAVLHLSGGHAGLIQGIFSSLGKLDRDLREKDLIDWLMEQAPERWSGGRSAAFYECERIWDNLSTEERDGLKKLAHNSVLAEEEGHRLENKHLVRARGKQVTIFSPLFTAFVRQQSSTEPVRLWVDEATHIVHLGPRAVDDFSPRVFKLVAFLYRNKNKICSRDDIFAEIYPDDHEVSDAALASLVKQARQQIDPDEAPYRFLKTVRGVGYMLLEIPEVKDPDVVSEPVVTGRQTE